MNTDPEMCGNLEKRGILKLKFDQVYPDLNGTGPQASGSRVERCRELHSDCLRRFGEVHRYNSQTQSQKCGGHDYYYQSDTQLLVSRYTTARLYDKVGNKSAITGNVYEAFLA